MGQVRKRGRQSRNQEEKGRMVTQGKESSVGRKRGPRGRQTGDHQESWWGRGDMSNE